MEETSVGRAVHLWGWGANSYGQLGNGSMEDVPTPQWSCDLGPLLPEGVEVMRITGGGGHTGLLLSDGSLLMCGCNSKGQVGNVSFDSEPGDGNSDKKAVLVGNKNVLYFHKVELPSSVRIVDISLGWDHSLALDEKGAVYGWGSNEFGQLGLGASVKATSSPKRLETFHILSSEPEQKWGKLPSAPKICRISTGLRHSILLDNEGRIYTCGSGRHGQLGYEVSRAEKSRAMVPRLVSNGVESIRGEIKKVVAGYRHSLVLTQSGSVYGFGCNRYGQLGQSPSQIEWSWELQKVELGSSLVGLECGWNHMVGWTKGTPEMYPQLLMWGRCDYGQLGKGEEFVESARLACEGQKRGASVMVDVYSPEPSRVSVESLVRENGDSTTQLHIGVSCGSEHSLATLGNGIFAWGWNEHGICGDGTENNVYSITQLHRVPPYLPSLAEGVPGITHIGCGYGHTLLLECAQQGEGF
eukprot:Nk52_evm32s2356 gene=Nk52_evmTU32s2356